jgi:hypothetical protein
VYLDLIVRHASAFFPDRLNTAFLPFMVRKGVNGLTIALISARWPDVKAAAPGIECGDRSRLGGGKRRGLAEAALQSADLGPAATVTSPDLLVRARFGVPVTMDPSAPLERPVS